MATKPGTSERLAPRHDFGAQTAGITSRSTSWNDDDRTFEFVLATETPCRSYRRDEDYNRIEIDEQIVISGIQDIGRLKGQPILDSHRRYSTEMVVGVIESARIEGSSLVCKGRLADVPSVAELAVKVRDGILTNMSVGFEILEEERSKRAGKLDLVRITKWQPHEASIVPIPADHNANIRSLEETETMTKPNETAPAQMDAATLATTIAEAVRAAFATQSPGGGADTQQRQAPTEADVLATREAALPGLRSAAERYGRAEDFDALAAAGEPLDGLRSLLRSAMETDGEEISSLTEKRAPEQQRSKLVSWEESRLGKRSLGLAEDGTN